VACRIQFHDSNNFRDRRPAKTAASMMSTLRILVLRRAQQSKTPPGPAARQSCQDCPATIVGSRLRIITQAFVMSRAELQLR